MLYPEPGFCLKRKKWKQTWDNEKKNDFSDKWFRVEFSLKFTSEGDK